MKILVELVLEIDDSANFLSATPNRWLEDAKEELELVLYDIDDITIERIYLEEL